MIVTEYYGNNDWRDYYLAHHGTLGMRWGRRRYQNPDGSLTPAGRARYGIGPPRDDGSPMTKREIRAEQRAVKRVIKSEKRAEKDEKKAAKSEAKAQKKAAEEEAKKERIIATGNANDIKKIQNRLTDDQMRRAVERIRQTQNLDRLRAEDLATSQKKTGSIVGKLGDLVSMGETAIKAYNLAAKMNNAFNPDTEMKIIGDKSLKSQMEDKAKKAAEKHIDDVIRRGSTEEIFKNLGKMDMKQTMNAYKKMEYRDKITKEYYKGNAADFVQNVMNSVGSMPLALPAHNEPSSKQTLRYDTNNYSNYTRARNVINR